jgi:hypothetical protein
MSIRTPILGTDVLTATAIRRLTEEEARVEGGDPARQRVDAAKAIDHISAVTPGAYAHALALALYKGSSCRPCAPRDGDDRRALARPTGVGRAITTYNMPIEGRDEWLVAVARHLA